MPKIRIIIFAAFILFACSSKEKYQSPKTIDAVVSIIPYKYFVEKIGGDKVSVNVLIPPSVSPHTFEPAAKQLKIIYESDIYFKVGGNFHFEEEVFQKIESDRINIIDCSVGIELINNNPHVWLGPLEAKIIAGNIKNELVNIDPADSSYFIENHRKFISEIDSLDKIIRVGFNKYTNKTFLVYHEAWIYFASHYGLTELAIESEGKEPGVNHMLQLINAALESGLKYVYISPGQNPKSALTVAGEIKAELDTLNTLPVNYLNNLKSVYNKIKRDFN